MEKQNDKYIILSPRSNFNVFAFSKIGEYVLTRWEDKKTEEPIFGETLWIEKKPIISCSGVIDELFYKYTNESEFYRSYNFEQFNYFHSLWNAVNDNFVKARIPINIIKELRDERNIHYFYYP